MISEDWVVIRADANRYWDVGQNKLVAAPTVAIQRMPSDGGVVMPGALTFSVTEDELPHWVAGHLVTATFTPQTK